jgi:AcrR family transcriptional regulator
MARPRFDHLEEERQEHLLAAAAEEFVEHGYAGASVNRILERAGLSKGVLYYYFEDKADLFATALERAIDRLIEALGMPGHGLEAVEAWLAGLPADGFWEGLKALGGREQIRLLRSEAWYVRLARRYHRLRDEAGARAATEGIVDLARRNAAALIDRGQAVGAIRSDAPRDLLVECFVALDEATDRWLVERLDQMDDDRLLELFEIRFELVRDLLDKGHEGRES